MKCVHTEVAVELKDHVSSTNIQNPDEAMDDNGLSS